MSHLKLDDVLRHVSDRRVRAWIRKRISDRDIEDSSYHTLLSHLSHPTHKTYERMLLGLMDEDGCTIGLAVARIGKKRFLRGLARVLAEQD
jgi:hypothetical protein